MNVILLAVLGAIVFIILIVLLATYNSLVSRRNKVREGFSGIHVQLKRRADLIPNLVETVKGYAQHERTVLSQIVQLRNAFLKTKPEDRAAIAVQDGMMTDALKRIFAVVENYPDLKASQNYLKLQESLEETEDQIAAARRIYNSNVNEYNTGIQQFPANIVARKFGFKDEPFYKIE